MKHSLTIYIALFTILFISSCTEDGSRSITNKQDSIFKSIPSTHSGIKFNNKLTFTEAYNPYTFKNFLNGGGVAMGDINNDGLIDIYLTGNLVGNKLYLNKGNFKFEDITKQAKVGCEEVWSSGASFVDINHDSYLDIYVCKSGKPDAPNRENQFFINNGDLTFTDKSKEYGMDFKGLSIHSAFFDYDKDGDLDCYLLNNSIRSVGAYDIIEGQRLRPNPDGGNKLLKNLEVETGQIKFEDVSQKAGIYTSSIGFGLGVSVADLNEDGWDDIFVSNDFFERDYLYLNKKDGTFEEAITSCIDELSTGSMGADIADLNNDALPEIFVTEMLPEDILRYKSKTVFDSYDKTKLNESKGYHRQYGRNVLQYNQGVRNGKPHFFELGRYHNVEATDWSWGALMADFDNNGMKDIFVANGIYKDLLDQDHINFYSPDHIAKMVKEKKENVILSMMNELPSTPLPNYLYLQNEKNDERANVFEKEKLPQQAGFSNGAAYADLDNDGSLDLVINNINESASIYKNIHKTNQYCKVKLKGAEKNTYAIGTKVIAYVGEEKMMLENHPMRGYQSCVSSDLLFGMGEKTKIDSLQILWPNQKRSTHYNLRSDSTYTFDQKDAKDYEIKSELLQTETLLRKADGIINFTQEQIRYPDFDRNRMIPFKLTNIGPKCRFIDLDNDKDKDLLMTGYARDGIKYFENTGNGFEQKSLPGIDERIYADNLLIEDFDKDGRQDALLLQGGFQFTQKTKDAEDLLLLNKKSGIKVKSMGDQISSAAATFVDINDDNNKDLLIFPYGRFGAYGQPADGRIYDFNNESFVLNNQASKSLASTGMYNDIVVDSNKAGKLNKIIAAPPHGPIVTYAISESEKKLVKNNDDGLSQISGLWQDIELVDVDQDGDQDIIACNIGENNRLKNLSAGKLFMFVSDFDNNGREDIIYCMSENGKHYPIHLKDELLMQMPKLKKKSLKYEDYSKISLEELFGENIDATVYEINEWRSGIFMNENNNSYTFKPFPEEVQYSEMKKVYPIDLNNDNYPDLILGGNQYEAKPELGINAASNGLVLINDKSGNFEYLPSKVSGFFEKGEIRDILVVDLKSGKYVLVFKSVDTASAYKVN